MKRLEAAAYLDAACERAETHDAGGWRGVLATAADDHPGSLEAEVLCGGTAAHGSARDRRPHNRWQRQRLP